MRFEFFERFFAIIGKFDFVTVADKPLRNKLAEFLLIVN